MSNINNDFIENIILELIRAGKLRPLADNQSALTTFSQNVSFLYRALEAELSKEG